MHPSAQYAYDPARDWGRINIARGSVAPAWIRCFIHGAKGPGAHFFRRPPVRHCRAMKTKSYLPLTLLSGAWLAFTAAPLQAANSNSGTHSSSGQSSSSQSANSDANHSNNSTRVRVTRASNFLGADVIASDHQKVGDIVDYYLDPTSTPCLKYVIVAQGDFLGYGGDARAVPAEAISMKDGTAHVQLSSDDFWRVPVLPSDRDRYLEDSRNRNQLAQTFNTSNGNSDQQGSTQNNASLVSFNDLRNTDVYGSNGQRLGRLVDTWMSLDANRAPYAEISSPPASPFEVLPRYRYAIPMNQLSADTNSGRLQAKVTENELRDSKPISETDGVKILQSGDIGREVLRVRVAQL